MANTPPTSDPVAASGKALAAAQAKMDKAAEAVKVARKELRASEKAFLAASGAAAAAK